MVAGVDALLVAWRRRGEGGRGREEEGGMEEGGMEGGRGGGRGEKSGRVD